MSVKSVKSEKSNSVSRKSHSPMKAVILQRSDSKKTPDNKLDTKTGAKVLPRAIKKVFKSRQV